MPGRKNILLSSRITELPGFTVCADVAQALECSKEDPRVFVIGGGSVYKQMLSFCDTAYITKVHVTPESDTFFPNLDEMDDWYIAETLLSGEENGISYEMLLYRRR